MIVRPAQLAHAIRAGTKKTHRVPAPPHARPSRGPVAVHTNPRPGDPARYICHIQTTNSTRQPLGHLTPDQARLEGHPTVTAFEGWWIETHDRAWLHNKWLDDPVFQQHLAEDPDDAAGLLREAVSYRYDQRWADRDVWVLEIQPVHDLPRLLAAKGGDEHGYTTSPALAVRDEPEVIPLDRIDPKWREHSQGRHRRIRRDQAEQARRTREQLTLTQRIMVAELAAYDRHIDIRDDVRLLRHMIDRGRPEHVVARQLAVVERRAHPGQEAAA